MTTIDQAIPSRANHVGAIVMVVSTLLTVAALADHPVSTAHDLAGALQEIAAARRTDQFVHGAVILALVGLTFAGTILARALDMTKARVLFGLVAYGFGSLITIFAALIDGFATPDLAQRLLAHPSQEAEYGLLGMLLFGVMIADLTKLGLILISAAIIAWSTLLLQRGGFARIAGVIGVIAGVMPPLLFSLYAALNPHFLIGLFLLQSLWNLSMAKVMFDTAAPP